MNFISSLFNKDIAIVQEVLENIAKYSTGDFLLTDENLNITYHNLKNNTEKKKCTLYDITANFINENIKNNIEKFRISDKNHLYLKLIFNDDEKVQNIPMDMHIFKIKNKNNNIKGYYVIIQDISQEIQNKIQRETFIDILTHDLKNPIRANIRILELILNNKFGEVENKLKLMLEEILNSFRFINYMTDNLLIKYKNEFNYYELQKQKCSLVQLIRNQYENLKSMFERKNQIVEFVIKGKIHEIELDAKEIGKVINNLLINASEQSGENSKIIVKIEENNNNVDVSFIDYGHNENVRKLNDIFEEYIACTNKFRKVGFSLELYNCRKIVEAHNGIISAQNAPKRGIEIKFSLPCI